MIWRVEWDERARRELRKLDHQAQRELLRYMRERIATDENPRRFGKGLMGDKAGLWSYRIGRYRLICAIEDENVAVLVLRVAHRKDAYDRLL